MTSKILDGKWLAKQWEGAIKARVTTFQSAALLNAQDRANRPPGLAVVLVGENPASLAYVGTKEKVARRCGFITKEARLPGAVSAEQLIEVIRSFNSDPEIDGILLQLPLSQHLNPHSIIDAIDPVKDVDGLHPLNQGLLMRGEGKLHPCTPLGVMSLIDCAMYNISGNGTLALQCIDARQDIDPEREIPRADLSGKSAVVVGRSLLVGKAAALMLTERNATVTLAHSRTKNLFEVTRGADIVVAAVGREQFLNADAIREGAVVIDVGINRTKDGRLVGDVAFDEVAKKCSYITPVPGGVGPMTVIMLMRNTLKSYEERKKTLRL